jgi:hypothetical protein
MRSEIVAGDTLDFLTSVSGYPATDGWTLAFRLVPRDAGNSVIEWDATAEGSDYRSQRGTGETATWDAGEYAWTSWVEKTGARHVVEQGTVTIKPNPATLAAGTDTRTTAARMVADLEAALVSYASSNGMVAEYAIAGRSMKFRDKAEIIKDLSYWKAQLFNEEEAERLRQGLGSRRRVYVRFGVA